jgi:hypothetical protein
MSRSRRLLGAVLPAFLLTWAGSAADASLATGPVTDAAGDFRVDDGTPNGYLGPNNPALDVLTANVIYDPVAATLTFTAKMAGPIATLVGPGNTNLGTFSWGINHGFGNLNFASIGLPGVLFDAVLAVNPNGTAAYRGNAAPAGSVTVTGDTITAMLPLAFLAPPPKPGNAIGDLLPVQQWSYNLWPRSTVEVDLVTPIPFGNAQIADFAPDDVDFLAQVVPEPASVVSASLGILAGAGVCWRRRLRKGTNDAA